MDTKRIASSSLDGFINIWNVEARSAIKTWKAHTNPVKILKLNDGSILSGSLDPSNALKIWDGDTGLYSFDNLILKIINKFKSNLGALIRVLSSSASQVTSLLSMENEGLVLSGHLDSTINVWNLTTGLTTMASIAGKISFKLIKLH